VAGVVKVLCYKCIGDRGSTVVEVLCYKCRGDRGRSGYGAVLKMYKGPWQHSG